MSIREKALAVQKQFATGKLKSAFHGPVYNQSGKLMVKKGANPPASFEQSITWLAKGMIGKTS
jgi:basic membrane protein A